MNWIPVFTGMTDEGRIPELRAQMRRGFGGKIEKLKKIFTALHTIS
jgi:hypothetical protein